MGIGVIVMRLCPCQENCVHYKSGSRMPPNNDVRNKYLCKEYPKGCKLAVYYETMIMGLTIACDINKSKRRGK